MNILLGVCGSISCYRAADLARDLMRDGHTVRVCLTDAAAKFVSPILFETLTGNPCLIDTFEEPIRGRMAHIEWAREADLILVAPATANTMVKLASGMADDMLTTLVVASTAPLVIAPAMNPSMYGNDAVRLAHETLANRAAVIIEPTEGDVVAGETGAGKLATNSEILAHVRGILQRSRALEGKHVLITSGPTEEPIDSVRFITNRSSGKMGAAVARAALLMGAKVTVIAGPQNAPLPREATITRVVTAEQMLEAARAHSTTADWIVSVAAVADYRPEQAFAGKLRRSADPTVLKLVPNPDIIASLAAEFPNARCVAFAAEPTSDVGVAREKLARKGVFAIAANDVSQAGIGFGADQNELNLLFGDGRTAQSERSSKLNVSLWLWTRLLEDACP